MMLRKLKWVGVAAIILLIAIPYYVYATEYKGEYKVVVSFAAEAESLGEASVSEFGIVCSEMGVLSLFDVLKIPHSNILERNKYTVYVEFNQSGALDTQTTDVILIPDGGAYDLSFEFFEKSPGESEIRVYIVCETVNTTVFDYTWEVMVG